MTRGRVAVGVAVTALLFGASLGSTAHGRDKGRGVASFAGSCSTEGTVEFDPAVTMVPQPLTYRYEATGVCDGTLNGKEVSRARVAVQQAGRSEGSCASAETTAPGDGVIVFAGGETITYTVEFTSFVSDVDFTFSGTHSGTATGEGTFRTERTSDYKASECATGLSEIPMDMTLTTESPLVSKKRTR